jgi:hypothetical protein
LLDVGAGRGLRNGRRLDRQHLNRGPPRFLLVPLERGVRISCSSRWASNRAAAEYFNVSFPARSGWRFCSGWTGRCLNRFRLPLGGRRAITCPECDASTSETGMGAIRCCNSTIGSTTSESM